MKSLLESINKELTTEDLDHLEKQRRQLEEEVEAGQQPTAPQTKEMTIEILQDYMENMALNFEGYGLKRWQVMEVMAYYEDLLSEKRKKAISGRKNHSSLRLLPPTSLSQGPPQAAIPALMFSCHHRHRCCCHRHLHRQCCRCCCRRRRLM